MTTITDAAGRAGHTPGPWEVRTAVRMPTIHGADGRCVASTGSAYKRPIRECEANARMIAAAPAYDAAARDLLAQFAALDDEFLRETAAEKDGTGIFTNSAPPLTPALARSVLAFRAALALAEGR